MEHIDKDYDILWRKEVESIPQGESRRNVGQTLQTLTDFGTKAISSKRASLITSFVSSSGGHSTRRCRKNVRSYSVRISGGHDEANAKFDGSEVLMRRLNH